MGFAVSLITGVGAALLTIVFLFVIPAFLCVGLMALALARLIHRAALLREDYCDGLGDCLPACPTGAISFEEREAPAYDEAAVLRAKEEKCGCPGAAAQTLQNAGAVSRLTQWPVQLRLAPVRAPYFDGADLLIAADCTAYAYGNFHNELIRDRITLIGCPKLDEGDYSEKLTRIIAENDIRSVTIARMQVPCCGGIEQAAKLAIQRSGKFLPWQVLTVTSDGRILD